MIKITATDEAQAIRAPSLARSNFSIDAIARDEIVTPGSSNDITTNDRIKTVTSEATIDHNFDLLLSDIVYGTLFAGAEFINLTPDNADIDQSGAVNVKIAGTNPASVIVKALGSGQKKRIDLSMIRAVGAETTILKEFVVGSLARSCHDAVTALIAGTTSAAARNFLSTRNTATSTYIRNVNRLAPALDWSGVMLDHPYDSRMNGAMISPLHFVTAAHFGAFQSTFRGLTAAGYFFERDVVAYSDETGSDIRISKLSAPLPAGCTFYKTLPPDWMDHVTENGNGIPVIRWNRLKQFSVETIYRWQVGDGSNGQIAIHCHALPEWSLPYVAGDSGGPDFIIIGGEPVLLGPQVFMPTIRTAINSTMTALGGGYQLESVDLSSYPTY